MKSIGNFVIFTDYWLDKAPSYMLRSYKIVEHVVLSSKILV